MSGGTRIHGMDALRGIAMWLGVVLHAVIAYQIAPRSGWPQDATTSIGMDWIYEYLHSFRMPLFFLVAGFFARFLSLRIGIKPFIRHRVKRILVPFILSIVFIVPISGFVFSVYRNLSQLEEGNLLVASVLDTLHWTGFYHIWFLYYLILLYIIQLVFQRVFMKLSINRKYVNEPLFIGSTIVLFLIQFYFYSGKVEPWTGLIPKTGQVLYYGYFYFLGFIVNANIDFLFKNKLIRYGYLVIGILAIPFISQSNDLMPYWLYALLLSVQTNLLILGHIAIFMHFFKRQANWVRYFSDASYWFYLIHFPIVVGLQLVFMSFNYSPWLKCFLIISITTIVSMISYEFFVRYTWIGTILNGKKERRKSITSYFSLTLNKK